MKFETPVNAKFFKKLFTFISIEISISDLLARDGYLLAIFIIMFGNLLACSSDLLAIFRSFQLVGLSRGYTERKTIHDNVYKDFKISFIELYPHQFIRSKSVACHEFGF